MVIQQEALKSTLNRYNGALPALWVIVGSEPLLALEAGDLLREAARKAGYTERVVFEYAASSDWSGLLEAMSSVSLFDDKKIVELRFLSSGPGIKGAKVLQEFTRLAPDSDSVLSIVHLTQVDYKTKQSAWFKHLTQKAQVINCDPITRERYPQWLQARLKEQGQSIQADALEFLSEQTEGNLLAAQQEMMKLSLLYPEQNLSLSQVSDSVMNVSRYSIDDLLEAIAHSDIPRVCRTLTGIEAEDEPLPLILMRLSSFIRDIITVHSGGRVFGRNHAMMTARRISQNKAANALARCADLDRLAKGLTMRSRDDVWMELKALCLFLAR